MGICCQAIIRRERALHYNQTRAMPRTAAATGLERPEKAGRSPCTEPSAISWKDRRVERGLVGDLRPNDGWIANKKPKIYLHVLLYCLLNKKTAVVKAAVFSVAFVAK
jgi:hypothetical protein